MSEFNTIPRRVIHAELVPELDFVSEKRRALYYFEWLDERQSVDIDHSFLESLVEKADINAQHGENSNHEQENRIIV